MLVLIAAGKSNRRIAQELFVGIGTVKTHISTTSTASYDAHSRTQALARARELQRTETALAARRRGSQTSHCNALVVEWLPPERYAGPESRNPGSSRATKNSPNRSRFQPRRS